MLASLDRSTEPARENGPPASTAERARATAEPGTVRQRVVDTLQRIARDVVVGELDSRALLRDQVDLDSMDRLNFVAALQEAFGIDIPETDYPRLDTLDGAVEYLAQKHAQSPRLRAPASRKHRMADGTAVTIRPIRGDDADGVRDLLQAASTESRYKRFQKWIEAPSSALVHFLTDPSPSRGVALVASVPAASGEKIIAEARCTANVDGKSCDLGLLVEDAWQKTGVAGLLMEALIDAARDRGFAAIEGLVLKSNAPMLQFARSLGFSIEPLNGERTTLRIRRPLQRPDAVLPGASSTRAPEPPAAALT